MTDTASEMRTYISRDEFGTFEANVARRFDGVGRAIEALSNKLDHISTKGTSWPAIGVLLTGGIAIAGLFAWGMNQRFEFQDDGIRTLAEWAAEHMRESATFQAETAADINHIDARFVREIDPRLRDFDARLRSIESTRSTRGDDQRLLERILALELASARAGL